jgi:hypothetical protein
MSGATLHDLPDPSQLVQAVRELLEGELAQATDGEARFLVRVAANALGVVERQLSAGPAQEADHAERLRRLGYADDAELVDAIRRGELDDRFEETLGALRQAVWDKVMVVNPKYVRPACDPFDRSPEPPLTF